MKSQLNVQIVVRDMPKDKFKWRRLEDERMEAMRRLELREGYRESYANKFSSKRAIRIGILPKGNRRKEKQIKNLFKKALILSEKLKEKKDKEIEKNES